MPLRLNLVAGLLLIVLIAGGCQTDQSQSDTSASNAIVRFTMVENKTDQPLSRGIRTEGLMNVVNGDIKYTRSLSTGKAFGQGIEIGNESYYKLGGKLWSRQENLHDALARAQVSLRTGLADPSRALDYLEEVSPDLRREGTEEVRGQGTQRFSATADLSKVGAPDGMDFSEDTWPKGRYLPLEVWVDDSGKVRRLVFENSPEVIQTWEFYDWGAEEEIAAPPADLIKP